MHWRDLTIIDLENINNDNNFTSIQHKYRICEGKCANEIRRINAQIKKIQEMDDDPNKIQTNLCSDDDSALNLREVVKN